MTTFTDYGTDNETTLKQSRQYCGNARTPYTSARITASGSASATSSSRRVSISAATAKIVNKSSPRSRQRNLSPLF
jgi:hypothetical protein